MVLLQRWMCWITDLCEVLVAVNVHQLQLCLGLCVRTAQEVVEDVIVPLLWRLAHYPALLKEVLLYGCTVIILHVICV